MWVKFTKTYTGPLGFFAKDAVMDLPESTVKKLKKYCRTCRAPWDEKKDFKAARKAEAEAELLRLKERAQRLYSQTLTLCAQADDLTAQMEAKRKEAEDAKTEYEKAAKAAKKAGVPLETNDDTEG